MAPTPYDPWDTGLLDAIKYLHATLDRAEVNTRSTSALRLVLDELDRLRDDVAITQPATQEAPNPFDAEAEVYTPSSLWNARAFLDQVRRGEVANLQFKPALGLHLTTVLDELDRLRNNAETSVTELERLGLRYSTDVARHYPAHESWTGEGLSVLELRVMAAHLSTALDNVTRALSAAKTKEHQA